MVEYRDRDAVIVGAVRTPTGKGKPGGRRAGMTLSDIDLFEVNEAFAPVVLAWAKEPVQIWPRRTSTAVLSR